MSGYLGAGDTLSGNVNTAWFSTLLSNRSLYFGQEWYQVLVQQQCVFSDSWVRGFRSFFASVSVSFRAWNVIVRFRVPYIKTEIVNGLPALL